MKAQKLFILIAVTFLTMTTSAFTQEADFFTNADGVALNGYDVVSYYTDYKAEVGIQQHKLMHDGVTFWFSSAEHKDMFKQNPDKYLPEYGGYCAFAIAAKSAKVPTDPKTFKIVDGKLYLFFNDVYEGQAMNTILPWNADEKNMRKQADVAWGKM